MKLKSIYNKIVEGATMLMVQPTMIFRTLTGDAIKTYHTVTEDEAARPDLIADEHYRDQSKLDLILKFNRISDPFSIKPGEILKIPNEFIAYYKLERPSIAVENNAVKQQFLDTKRLSKEDERRVIALKKKYGKEELLPPNVIPTGKKTYEFDGGTIRLGKQAQTAAVTQSNTAQKLLDMLDANGNEGSTDGTNNGDNAALPIYELTINREGTAFATYKDACSSGYGQRGISYAGEFKTGTVITGLKLNDSYTVNWFKIIDSTEPGFEYTLNLQPGTSFVFSVKVGTNKVDQIIDCNKQAVLDASKSNVESIARGDIFTSGGVQTATGTGGNNTPDGAPQNTSGTTPDNPDAPCAK